MRTTRLKGFFIEAVILVKTQFHAIIDKLGPTLKRITYRLNGHFTFFGDEDLYQEALSYLWGMFQDGAIYGKTDSYLLQGCYFHLKNYIRKTADKAHLVSLDKLIDDNDSTLEDVLSRDDNTLAYSFGEAEIIDAAEDLGLNDREMAVFKLLMEGRTVREIGHLFGVSHVMILKIKNKLKNKCAVLKNFRRSGYQN